MSETAVAAAPDRPKMTVSATEVAIDIVDMNKWYGDFHVLRDINLKVMRGRAHRRLRPVGLGQVDA